MLPVERPLKFIVVPMGSAGDVHPLIWLARLLAARGHEVVMVTQAMVAEMAQRAGLRFISVGHAEKQEALVHHPDIWHPRRAFDLIARHMPAYAQEMLPVIHGEIEHGKLESGGGRTVLIAGTLAFAARIAAERWDVPLLSVHLQPSLMMSVEESSVMFAGMEWMTRAPRWVRRAFFGMAHWQIDRKLRRPLGRVRRKAGVKGKFGRGIMRQWWHSPDAAICLFPEWYARKAADWPPQTLLSRFALYDEGEVMEKDQALEGFLKAGEAPVVITPGSANAQATRFLKEAASGCELLGRRALLVTRYPEQVPQELREMPETVRTVEYAPFGRLFSRAAAVVHHGGIGTTAQCLAAGVPQLIMPLAHDQPDNALRVKKMGGGDYLYPRKFRAAAVAERLRSLIDSPATRSACAKLKARMARQMTGREMVDLVELHAERALRVRQINGVGVPSC